MGAEVSVPSSVYWSRPHGLPRGTFVHAQPFMHVVRGFQGKAGPEMGAQRNRRKGGLLTAA